MKESGHTQETPRVAQQLATADDPTPVIVDAAIETPPCPLCAATLTTFVSILGAEAGNLALKVLATGGVYVGGDLTKSVAFMGSCAQDCFRCASARKPLGGVSMMVVEAESGQRDA